MRLTIESPTNCWWYEMHIAGMVGNTITVDGKEHKVIFAAPVGRDEPFDRTTLMELELEPTTLREARDHW